MIFLKKIHLNNNCFLLISGNQNLTIAIFRVSNFREVSSTKTLSQAKADVASSLQLQKIFYIQASNSANEQLCIQNGTIEVAQRQSACSVNCGPWFIPGLYSYLHTSHLYRYLSHPTYLSLPSPSLSLGYKQLRQIEPEISRKWCCQTTSS